MKHILNYTDKILTWIVSQSTKILLLCIVLVVLYSVLLRYVFDAPPFWSDRIGIFANMGMVLFGLSLTVRNRELIAMQGLYTLLPAGFARALEIAWTIIILVFALMFTWYGADAAANMPGQYWDFQDFCIDLGDGGQEAPGLVLTVVKLIESAVAALVWPLCVDGAIPQRYLAMLMPASGMLIVIACLAVLIEDCHALVAGKRLPPPAGPEL